MVRGGAGADGVETGGEDGAVLLVPPSRTVRGSVTDLGLSQAVRPRLRTVLAEIISCEQDEAPSQQVPEAVTEPSRAMIIFKSRERTKT